MKGNTRNFMEWLGQPRDPQWTAYARKKNNAIMKKYAKGSASLESICFIIVTSLFVGLLVWLVLTVWRDQ